MAREKERNVESEREKEEMAERLIISLSCK